MILAAGLSPAWQQVLVLDRFLPGEVNRAREVRWFPAGKVVNCARAGMRLHRRGLGDPWRGLTVLGGPSGEALLRSCEEHGVDLAFVRAGVPTRICTTIIPGGGAVTELVENARPLRDGELEEFRARFRSEASRARAVVLIGSLPAGTPPGIYRDLLDGVEAPAVIDARGPELLEALGAHPFLVKPNREELGKTFGRDLESEEDLRGAMVEVARRGARWVLITAGRAPALALGDGRFWRFHVPEVAAVNPIGSGDCVTAAIAAATVAGADPIEAIRTGMAAGAENATTLFPADIDGEMALRLRERVGVDSL